MTACIQSIRVKDVPYPDGSSGDYVEQHVFVFDTELEARDFALKAPAEVGGHPASYHILPVANR